jgi:NADPH2:quinone reductase
MSKRAGRRILINSYGATPLSDLNERLTIQPQTPIEITDLGPNDVVVGVRSAAVGWVDLLMAAGQYQHLTQPPYTPGLEFSGEVLSVGESVSTTRVGDRVIADGFWTGPRSTGDYQTYGGFAAFAIMPEKAAIPLPDSLSYDQGANLLGNYETAYHCLITRGRLQSGQTVLIHGASGSTGLAAVHVAKLVGATVIATGRSPKKLAVVATEGADHTIVTTNSDGPIKFRDQVKEVTGGVGVDVVYDGVGGATSLESLRCVRFGAKYLIVGWAATPFAAGGKGRSDSSEAMPANTRPTNLLMMKGLDVLGCPTVISTLMDPSIRSERLQQIMAWVTSGQLKPRVAASFSFDQVAEALEAKWESQYVGGIVLHPS